MKIDKPHSELVHLTYRGLDLGWVTTVDDIIVITCKPNEWAYGLDVIDALKYYSKHIYEE